MVAEWTPEMKYEAFPGVLNGGIIGTLLDCHCNWTAAWHLMNKAGADYPPCTVTADYAIKLLRPDLARDPSFQNRFRREAQAAAGLNHPSIVAVYDTGEDDGVEGHTPYIVMEYVEGHTLRDVLKAQGHLPSQQAMEITAEVCAALDFSHRSGIVHRDIKPGNVMITDAGAIKVMDFGIARALADASSGMTQTQAVIGTAQYLSPEQARGDTVDARSDPVLYLSDPPGFPKRARKSARRNRSAPSRAP